MMDTNGYVTLEEEILRSVREFQCFCEKYVHILSHTQLLKNRKLTQMAFTHTRPEDIF